MSEREIVTLNESTPQLEVPQSGDTYLAPRKQRFADDVVMPDTTGKGLRVGDADADSFGWRDITAPIEVRGTGGTDPDWVAINGTAFWAYRFALNDKVWMTFHMPHDYVPDTDIHFHAHWLTDGTDVNSVKWQWEYAFAQGFNQAAFPFASPGTATAEQAGPGVQYQHMVTETTGITIANLEIDGMVHVVLTRITNGGTDNTDDVFLLTSDIHYQSTNMATLNKAPSFYG
jgi:hypothetical protein